MCLLVAWQKKASRPGMVDWCTRRRSPSMMDDRHLDRDGGKAAVLKDRGPNLRHLLIINDRANRQQLDI
jgi:hypothetical protein